MANISEKNEWQAIPQIEDGEVFDGGIDGNANKQAKALASRTAYLKKTIQTHTHTPADIGAAPTGYGLGTSGIYIPGVDLNTIYKFGCYWVDITNPNRPPNTDYGVLIAGSSVAGLNDVVTQIFFSHENGMYQRVKYGQGGVWSNWLEISRKGHTHISSEVTDATHFEYGNTLVRRDANGDFAGRMINAAQLNCWGFDFRLGFADQYSRGNSGWSRALVKGEGSLLIVNYAGDFTGGVKIHSALAVHGVIRPTIDNAFSLGLDNYRISQIYAASATISTSDRNAKTDILDTTLGLDFINALRPVEFKYKVRQNKVTSEQYGTEPIELEPERKEIRVVTPAVYENERLVQEEVTEEIIIPAVTEERPTYKEVVTPLPGIRTHVGLIAQEVETALGDKDIGLLTKDNETGQYGLRYEEFIAPLIKGMQELSAKVDQQAAEIAELKQLNSNLVICQAHKK